LFSRRTEVREDLNDAGREAALRGIRHTLHEEHDLVVGDNLADLALHLGHLLLLGGGGGGGRGLLLGLELKTRGESKVAK